MTAEEKAEEFVLLFFRIQDESNETTWNQAKQCALIAVEEVINSMTVATSVYLPFWQQVKIEIKQL